MSAALPQKQEQQEIRIATTTASPSYNSSTANCGISSYTSSSAVSVSTLPTSFITAQNCLSNNLRPLQVTALAAAGARQTTTTTVTLMLKSIDNPSNQTDRNENAKEEEETKDKENESDACNVLTRRQSAPEGTSLNASKLNTIEEGCEFHRGSLLSSSLNLKTQRNESLTSIAGAAAAAVVVAPDTTTSSDPTEDTKHPSNSSIESSNSATTVSNINQQFADSSNSNQSKDSDNTTEVPTTQNITSSSSDSPRRKSSSASSKSKLINTPSCTKIDDSTARADEDTISKSSDTSGELVRATPPSASSQPDSGAQGDKPKGTSRLSERAKKKSWYNVLYPNYKSRSQDFKKLFKEVPQDERLIVDYSCALQRDILVQGRLYVSQNYVCFHANIFRWETYLTIKWKDVTAITKEKTALVIPNAISISTAKEKYFFATFTARDKAFLMLFRVWQNTLMNKPMLPQEIWQWVHNCYGDELGLTSDDEDYIDPSTVPVPTECETDLDFVSALEDTQSIAGGVTDYNTAQSSSTQSINQAGGDKPHSSSKQPTSGGGGSTSASSGSSGGGAGDAAVTKSKSRSFFFNSNKSNLNSSNNASASGSDNKASDNNSQAKRISSSKMKANAKELTLVSAMPEEGAGNGAAESANGSGGAKDTKSSASSTAAATTYDNKRKAGKHSRQRDENSIGKNSEASPTDISDSSDSDENKIPFVATAECNSTHEGRQLMHTILPINVDTLFNLLFNKSKFLVDFHEMRKSTDTSFGEWTTNEEGQKIRIVNLTVQLAASVGPKTSKVTEEQVMRDCSKPGEMYSIDVTSVNAGIPYADSFSVLMHYCLVRTVDEHTMLSVHAQIKYKKSIWGVVKGFIEKNTWAGLEDFYTSLLHALQSETCLPPAKGKGRRPRRGTASQVRPLEELPPTQAKAEAPEKVHAAHALAPHQPAKDSPQSGERGDKHRWLSVFVLVLLCFLISLNVILLLKLWQLEARIEDDLSQRARMPNLASLKQLPNTHQDWLQLLRQQEMLHETELRKWHSVLQTAIELLRKTEKTLAALLFG